MKQLSPPFGKKENFLILLLTWLLAFPVSSQSSMLYPHSIPAPKKPKPPACAASNLRSSATYGMLDYGLYNQTYDEFLVGGISFNGGWYQNGAFYEQELTSFVDTASGNAGKMRYIEVAFDTIAFASLGPYWNTGPQGIYYYPRSACLITLDTLVLTMGIYGDTTVADGVMAHDSLVITVYRITGDSISVAPVNTIVFSGYAGLAPFLTGTSTANASYAYVNVPVGQQFNQGESFAVRVDYLNKDTSSHCFFSYTWGDSCGTIVYQGVPWPSPACPSALPHRSKYGLISSSGPAATVLDLDDQATLPGLGLPPNCSYTYYQNWDLVALLSMQVNLGVQITPPWFGYQPSCLYGFDSLYSFVYGTDTAGLTYSWTANGCSLQTTTGPNNFVYAFTSNNPIVILTVSTPTATASDTVVLNGCHLIADAGSNQTICSGSNVILAAAASYGVPPYSYSWQSAGDVLNCPACQSPSVTITQNSVFTLTVTDAINDTATASVAYTVNGTVNQVHVSVTNTIISCINTYDTTVATVTGGAAPYSFNWGNGSVSTGGSPQSFYYYEAGPETIAVTDADGCVTTVADSVLYNGPAVTLVEAVKPVCPSENNGEIIVALSGGTAPYYLYWTNGSTSDTILNAPAGSYQLYVTDAHNCHALFDYTLEPQADFDYFVNLNATAPNCTSAGVVYASAYSGTPPYDYVWNNSVNIPTIHNAGPGYYSVTVTDAVGCTTSGSLNLVQNCASVINGVAFVDSIGNCVFNTADARLNELFIQANSSLGNAFYATTDSFGNYSIQVTDTGLYTLSVTNGFYYSFTCGNLSFCNNTAQTVYLPVLGDTSGNNNIAYTGANGFDLAIYPGWTSANPGFTKQYWIYYSNFTPIPVNGPATLTFEYDSNLVYSYSDTPLPAHNAQAHTLTWQLNSVPAFTIAGFADAYFQVPASLSYNYPVQSDFRIEPYAGDCDTSNNHFNYAEIVTGSFDPNEKDVIPARSITEGDSLLTYTIHFQNTGTDSTHFIVVKDTLSPNLDPATVRNLASSDKFTSFDLSGSGILTWTFNPLRVVDSLTNPSGSKRFIIFSVKRKGNLPFGTIISNSASIYFDYSSPVVTNTIADTIVNPAYIPIIEGNGGITVRAFPNPFNDVTNVVVTGLSPTGPSAMIRLQLYDVTGRLLQNIVPQNNLTIDCQFQVHRNGLANGIYFYGIMINEQRVAYGKLIVE